VPVAGAIALRLGCRLHVPGAHEAKGSRHGLEPSSNWDRNASGRALAPGSDATGSHGRADVLDRFADDDLEDEAQRDLATGVGRELRKPRAEAGRVAAKRAA
jgi:hypothetical protein